MQLREYPLEDISAAVGKLSLTRRQEGETAFPDLATIDEAVRAVGRDRRIAEARIAKAEQEAAEERHKREHPEEYVSIGDLVGDFYRKAGQMPVEELPPSPPAGKLHDQAMAALSRLYDADVALEPSVQQQILEWRKQRG
jgi:hypothetical protein